MFCLLLSADRLFGVDEDGGEGAESEESEVAAPMTQPCPSYAATVAMATTAGPPVTATLTGWSFIVRNIWGATCSEVEINKLVEMLTLLYYGSYSF